VLYRLGFANSRAQARQLVRHGHVAVDGKVVNLPSYLIEVGEMVSVAEPSRQLKEVTEAIELSQRRGTPPWIALERDQFRGSLRSLPARADITIPISEKLIVEHYSK
jgi:small subunit ribosomal protein S4